MTEEEEEETAVILLVPFPFSCHRFSWISRAIKTVSSREPVFQV